VRAVLTHVRLTVLVARPQLITLLSGFGVLGVVLAGGTLELQPVLSCVTVVAAFVVAAVAVNDVADVAVDRVNLAHDPRRPLVGPGAAAPSQLVAVAVTGALTALVVGATASGLPGLLVVAAGLVLVVAYSLPPIRLSGRGVVAPLVLPAGYVAVPLLTGVLAAGGSVTGRELAVLAAAYVGFVGRILLKDFRDVVGDRLLGKRTFLVRHGQRITCAVAGACWVAGSLVTRVVAHPGPALDLAYGVRVVVVLGLLALLAQATHPVVQTSLVSATAVLGRGLVLSLVLHLLAVAEGLGLGRELLVQGAVLAAELATAWRMTGRGTLRGIRAAVPERVAA
jgi:4-hydroxybenzoate polyprenyltransferase